MEETIKQLKEYANLSEDWYTLNRLKILEIQIKSEINRAKLEIYKQLNKTYKNE